MYRATRVVGTSALLVLAGLVPAEAGTGNDQWSKPQAVTSAATSDITRPAPGTVRIRKLASSGRSVARIGDTLWREAGDVVQYSSTGEELGRVTGIPSSVNIAANEEESVLYSASWDDNSITAIDPGTRSPGQRWHVRQFPLSVAASGNVLFYSWAPAGRHGGIDALDLTSGSWTQVLSAPTISHLALRGSTLLALGESTVSTYSVDGTTLTPLAVRDLAVRTWALSPEGDELLVTTNDAMGIATLHRLATDTLTTTLRSALDVEVNDVAWSPDGTRYALGLESRGVEDVVRVFDASSNALVSRSQWPGAAWPDSQLVSRLAFLRSQPVLIGLGGHQQLGTAFVTASTLPGIRTGLALTTTKPKQYGKRLHAEVKATGCASPCTVRFTLKDALAGKKTFTRTLTSGSLTMDLAVKGNGTLRAETPADLRRLPVVATRSHQVPARLAYRLTGRYRLSGTTAVHKGRKPTIKVAVAPARRVAVRVTTQWKFDGEWTAARTRIVYTNSLGVVTFRSNWTRDSRHRLVLRVLKDDVVGASAGVVTRPMRWV